MRFVPNGFAHGVDAPESYLSLHNKIAPSVSCVVLHPLFLFYRSLATSNKAVVVISKDHHHNPGGWVEIKKVIDTRSSDVSY
jgi:hypothetical protein